MNFRFLYNPKVGFIVLHLFLFLLANFFLFSSTTFAEDDVLFSDSFTDSDYTPLTTHDPNWIPMQNNNAFILGNKLIGHASPYYYNKFVTTQDGSLSYDIISNLSANIAYEQWLRQSHIRLSMHTDGSGELDLFNGSNWSSYLLTYPAGHFQNATTYTFKSIVMGNSLYVYINGELQYENDTAIPSTTSTQNTFAFNMYNPTDFPNNYFDVSFNATIDNLQFTDGSGILIPATLNVPYFNQNSLPWGPTEYDSAQSLGISDPTMDRWGCAVTSAAMVLNYHGMTKFVNNTTIDPGSLNIWLKQNNGYLTGKGKNGSYSFLIWNKIGQLTRNLFNESKSTVKLVHKQLRNVSQSTLKATLTEDLMVGNNIGKFPDIIKVANTQTSGHFVVAKGDLGTTFAINDPEWNSPDLTSFGNTLSQVDRFIPSHTDFSSIEIIVNPDIEILVTDPDGNKTGKVYENGQLQEYNQIPGANYGFSAPIGNPGIFNENLGTGVNEFWMESPINGNYTVTLSTNQDTYFTINTSSFQTDGDDTLVTTPGILQANDIKTLTLTYDDDSESNIDNSPVTFQTTIDDINNATELGLIDKGANEALLAIINNSKRSYDNLEVNSSVNQLSVFNNLLNRLKGKQIDPIAWQILAADLESLKLFISTP